MPTEKGDTAMTCVGGIEDRRTVILGADSAAAAGDEIYTLDLPKVFARGAYLFGYCGSYRIGQILRYRVELPEPPIAGELEPFFIRELIPAIRHAVEKDGAAGPGRAFLGEKTTILMGCRAQLWCIMSDLTVVPAGPFAAIGSGRLRAYAALHALQAVAIEPAQRRLKLALEASAAFTSSVRPPWVFIRSTPEEPRVSIELGSALLARHNRSP
jgi:ATP-dependent protease HslVU (ClpYQ) peptidase subunit